MRKLLAIVLLAIAGSALGQSGNFPALVGQRGTTLPTNCTIGQLFFDTDATAGGNIYGCTAANTWTQMEGGSAITGCTYAANVLTCPTITATTQLITGTFLIQPYAGGVNFGANGNYPVSIFADNLRLRASASIGFDPSSTAYGGTLDLKLTRYAAKQLMISGDGTGATTNAGIIAGYSGTSGSGLIDNSTAGALRIGTSLATSIIMGSGSIEVLPGADNGLKLGSNSFRWRDLFISGQIRAGNAGGYMAFADVAGAGPSITAGTATTDVNALNITGTWNAGAIAFTGIKANFTNTASAAGTKILDLQIGGSPIFSVLPGSITTTVPLILEGARYGSERLTVRGAYAGSAGAVFQNTSGATSPGLLFLAFDNNIGGTLGGVLTSDGYGTLLDGISHATIRANSVTKIVQTATAGAGPSITAGTATTDVNALSLTQTWNAAGVAFNAIDLNVTNTASAAGANLMRLRLGGTAAFTVGKNNLTLGAAIVTPASSGTRYLCIDTSGVVTSSASACSGT